MWSHAFVGDIAVMAFKRVQMWKLSSMTVWDHDTIFFLKDWGSFKNWELWDK